MTKEEAIRNIKSEMCKKCGVYLGGGECDKDCRVTQCIETLSNQRKIEDMREEVYQMTLPGTHIFEDDTWASIRHGINLALEIIDKHIAEISEAYKMAIKVLSAESCREIDDYENEIADLKNRLDIAEYDKERLREEVTNLKEKIKALEQEPCEEHQREFIELVVEYINPDLCPYPEYRGKPYFSIKYRENGKNYIGFGTYKIEILSQWIKEYFISNIQIPEPYKAESEDKE